MKRRNTRIEQWHQHDTAMYLDKDESFVLILKNTCMKRCPWKRQKNTHLCIHAEDMQALAAVPQEGQV